MIGFKLERKISIDSIEVKDSLINCGIGVFLASLYFIFPELRAIKRSKFWKYKVLCTINGCIWMPVFYF